MDLPDDTRKPLTLPGTRRPPVNRRASPAIVRVEVRSPPGGKVQDLGPLLDTNKAAARISKSRSWLYAAVARGDFVRPIYIGREAFYPQAWVDAWIAAQVQAQVDEQG